MPDRQQIYKILQSLVNATSPDEAQYIVETHPELLSDDAEIVITDMWYAARAQSDERATRIFEHHRDLLRRCREIGTAAAFAEKTGGNTGIQAELAQLLAQLPPDLLPTFLQVLQTATDEESFNRELQKHPDLLAALQHAAPPTRPASTNLPSELQPILDELNQPIRSLQDIPRRIDLCRRALALVNPFVPI